MAEVSPVKLLTDEWHSTLLMMSQHWINKPLPEIMSTPFYVALWRHKAAMNQLFKVAMLSLQWRHKWRHGLSNHQPHDCLLNRLLRRRPKKTSKHCVTGFVRGIHRWPMNSPHKWPVTRKMSGLNQPLQNHIKTCDRYAKLWVVVTNMD